MRRDVIILTFLLLIVLTGCGGDPVPTAAPAADATTAPTEQGVEETAPTDPAIPAAPEGEVISPLEGPLTGPAPYPAPGDVVTAWDTLIDRTLFDASNWSIYLGELEGETSESRWSYGLQFPEGWPLSMEINPSYFSVQNQPDLPSGAPAQDNVFAQFEVVRLGEIPIVPPDQTLEPQDVYTVSVAAEPGVLHIATLSDTERRVLAVFEHQGIWLVAGGHITLEEPDPAAVELYTAMILTMLESLEIQ